MAGARTAVLMVHGMGNQRPLATVRAVVKALYGDVEPQPGDSIPRRWWTKLDRDVGDIDLPVIVTAPVGTVDAEGKPDTRVIDFHECYWASEMAESRLAAVPMWLFELVRKGPSGMQRAIRALWFIFGGLLAFWILCGSLALLTLLLDWVGDLPTGIMAVALPWGAAALLCFFTMGWRGLALLALVSGVLALAGLPGLQGGVADPGKWPMALGAPGWLIVALAGLALFVLLNWFFLLTVAGDAARYLRAAPSNIAVRRSIRSNGAEMLRRLHAQRWGKQPKYDRIIVVAHSLGTVVAYDMLRAYWGQVAPLLGDPHALGQDAVVQDNFGVITAGPDEPVPPPPAWTAPQRSAWRNRGRALIRALDARALARENWFEGDLPPRWIVTDFVTLGSPLSQADFLLAEGSGGAALAASFARKTGEREFPTCPPAASQDHNLSYGAPGRRLFHHGALFGLTRWTNLFFPVRAILWGDLVGGPMQRLFGQGVEDVPVSGAPLGNIIAHTAYWESDKPRELDDGKGHKQVLFYPLNRDDRTHHLNALRHAVNLRDVAETMPPAQQG
jgi:hypothetical protein